MERVCKKCSTPWDDDKKSSLCPDCRSKLGRRSKRKGSANEHRFAQYLNKKFEVYGLPYRARRTPRSGGIREFEASDMMFRFVPPESVFARTHFENKNTAQWDIVGWMIEATKKEAESGKNRIPVLIIRRPNEHEEYAVLKMEDYVQQMLSLEINRILNDR